jgi:ubiquinone biosynthesis protein UbiJ
MKLSLSQLSLPIFNRLLREEPWALKQLQIHAGKIAYLDLSPLMLRIQVTASGLLETAPDDAAAAVTIRINPADLPLILQNQQRMMAYVKLEGDADLAHTIADLVKNLRWDIEHQLSALFGDIAANRMTTTGKTIVNNLHNAANKWQENWAEYFLEENPMLVRPSHVAGFAEQVGRVRDDVERLMKRIEKLEKK